MLARLGRATAVALVSLGAACVPQPSGNEINVSDEGMADGVAASRNLTPVALDTVAIGRALERDRSIKDEADSFQPQDTVYASIRVSGTANSGLVRALWTDQRGQKVQDDTRIVTPSNGETVAVQVKPAQGWAGGRYRLDVYLDDKLAATRNFSVEGAEASPNEPKAGDKANPVNH